MKIENNHKLKNWKKIRVAAMTIIDAFKLPRQHVLGAERGTRAEHEEEDEQAPPGAENESGAS